MYYLLFTTSRCPKCPAFKDFVQKFLKISGRVLDETESDFSHLCEQFEVTAVPKIFIFGDQSYSERLLSTSDVSELYSFVFQKATN